MMRQRNARLADALGIRQPVDRTLTEWPAELRSFAAANLAFVKTVENTFRDFINGTRQTVILPHMPPAKRTFVMSMADVYRLGRELIDAEPNRSVQIRRRVDTRLPNPLLSVAVQPPPSKLGGLGNLRAAPSSVWGASRSGTASPSTAASAAKANTPTASGPSSRVPSPGAEQARPTPPEPPRAHVPVTHTHVPVQTVGVVGDTDWDQSGDEAD
jgi:transcriptional repressor NF-X1